MTTTNVDPAFEPFVKVRLGAALGTDSDPGPAAAYSWVKKLSEQRDFVCTLDPFIFRARGYVMWNKPRLDDWGFFNDFHLPTQSADDGTLSSQ